jgi:hypothetical protein
MDFLDPKKERRNRLMLLLGYCLIALAIGIATLVLLYQSYGYDVDRQGRVTQNGLVFVSSQPNGAAIYLNDKRYKSDTDTRVSTPAGSYVLRVSKTGYRPWQRDLVVNGGDVQHFDYPFLFPEVLKPTSLGSLQADPAVATQSPDRRWLLLGQSENSGSFLLFDLKNPAKPVTSAFSLPEGSFTAGDATGAQSWEMVDWAADNRHVLLLHNYVAAGAPAHEYVLVDRSSPASSLSMTNALKLTQTDALELFNDRTSQFYVYDSSEDTLSRVNADDNSVVSKLTHVLAYKAYSDNKVLYVTDQPPTGKAVPNQVSVVLQDGQKITTLRAMPASSGYVLELAQYSGDWYIAMGAASDAATYVYKNPQSQQILTADGYPAPWRRLPIKNPSYIAFSNNTQYLLAESGQNFAVYDFENSDQYKYTVSQPMDNPQLHAKWMDGNRLEFVSDGKLVVFDYDYRNLQTLVGASPVYLPAYSSDYSYLYTIRGAAGNGSTQPALMSTPLTTKAQ